MCRVEDVNWYRACGGHERLVRLLPSLKELSLDPPPKEYNFFMNKQLATMILTFPDKLERSWGRQASTTFDPNEYLSKPTLRRLKLDGMHNRTHTASPGSSAVTDLSFANWDPEGVSILTFVLPSIRHLRHLALEVHRQWQVHRTREPIHRVPPLHYGPLLESHSASLEDIISSYSNEEYNKNSMHFPRTASPLIGTEAQPFSLPAAASTGRAADTIPLRNINRRQTNRSRKAVIIPPFQDEKASHEQRGVGVTAKVRDWTTPAIYHNPTRDPIEGPTDYLFKLAEDFRKVGVKFEFVLAASFDGTPFAEYLLSAEKEERESGKPVQDGRYPRKDL